MKKSELMEQTGAIIRNWSREDFEAWMLDYAGALPVKDRDRFLENLREAENHRLHPETKERSREDTLRAQTADILSTIRERVSTKALGSVQNKVQTMWGWDTTYSYRDSCDILPAVRKGFKQVSVLAEAGMYREAEDLCREILDLKIRISGPYAKARKPEVTLDEIDISAGNSVSVKQMVLSGALSACYTEGDPEKRAQIICDWLMKYQMSLPELEKRAGAELPGYGDFLRAVCLYTAGTEGEAAEKILRSAMHRVEDPAFNVGIAVKSAALHPDACAKYLRGIQKLPERAAAAKEILPAVTDRRKKADIAGIGADAARRAKQEDDQEYFLLEQFKAWPDLETGLPLFYFFPGRNEDIIRDIRRDLHGNEKYEVAFLAGDLDMFLDELTHGTDKETRRFMEKGTALLLLYLAKTDELPADLGRMTGYVFQDEQTKRIFLAWKKTVPADDAQIARILPVLEDAIHQKTDHVMKNDIAWEYEECALFAAALGDAEESLGIRTKQEVLAKAAARYPRRINYLRELRELGYTPASGKR